MRVLEEAKHMIGAIQSPFEVAQNDIDPTSTLGFTALTGSGALNDRMWIIHRRHTKPVGHRASKSAELHASCVP